MIYERVAQTDRGYWSRNLRRLCKKSCRTGGEGDCKERSGSALRWAGRSYGGSRIRSEQEGGITLGILPGTSRADANPWIDITVLSGMGQARNVLIAQSSDALIAVNGEYGTLSEIVLGLKIGKPVIVLESKWEIEGTYKARSPEEAVELAFALIERYEKIEGKYLTDKVKQ